MGFGSGIISLTLLAFLWEIQDVVAVTAGFSIVVTGYLGWRLRAHISLTEIKPLIVGAAIGIPLGVTALTSLDPRTIKGALGGFLLLYSTWSLWGRTPSTTQINQIWAFPAGLFGGMLSGAFNAGGPPVVMYGTERQWTPDAFRGNVQGFFAPCAALTLSLLIYKGVVSAETLAWNAKLLPFLVAGMVLGDRKASGIAPGPFRRILLVSLWVVGVVFLRAALGPR